MSSAQFGNGLCTVDVCGNDFADPGTAVPRGGSGWAWFGGTVAPNHEETATLTQAVVFPQGATLQLDYFLRIGFVSTPFDAVLRVLVDEQVVETIAEPALAEGDYAARSINLSAFADGQSHTIRFEYVNPGTSGKSNFNVDDVSLSCLD